MQGGQYGGMFDPNMGDPRIMQPSPWGGPQPNDPRPIMQGPGSDFGMPKEIPHAPSNGGVYNPTTNPGGTQLPPNFHSWDDNPGGFPGGLKPPPDGGYAGPSGQQIFTSGSIGNGGGTQGPMSTMGQFMARSGPAQLGGVATQGPIQQQMQQGGGFYAPPAMTGGQQQPMNPGQQSGQVGMMSPTGQFQYVNSEHVPHYQSLGATLHNGSSYGSPSGGY
jgi:hypothetical protein